MFSSSFEEASLTWIQSLRLRCALLLVAMCAACMLSLWFVTHRTVTRETIPKTRVHFLLEINEATVPDWCMLPGLGETTALKIVQARDARGGFENVNQLMTINGLGAHTMALIRPYVFCRNKNNSRLLQKPSNVNSPTAMPATNPATQPANIAQTQKKKWARKPVNKIPATIPSTAPSQ